VRALLVLLLIPSLAVAGDYVCKAETQTCLNEMASKLKRRGWVGIEMDIDEVTHAVKVARVVDGSPAKAAGLLAGDVLMSANGVALVDEAKMKKQWESLVPGKTIEYLVLREGVEKKISLILGELPPAVLWEWIGQHMLDHHAKLKPAVVKAP
jgi:predicted metalloprotease with PDZ domain